jgi:hypothetical protein
LEIGFCFPPLTSDITAEIVEEKSGIVELTSQWSADRLDHFNNDSAGHRHKNKQNDPGDLRPICAGMSKRVSLVTRSGNAETFHPPTLFINDFGAR